MRPVGPRSVSIGHPQEEKLDCSQMSSVTKLALEALLVLAAGYVLSTRKGALTGKVVADVLLRLGYGLILIAIIQRFWSQEPKSPEKLHANQQRAFNTKVPFKNLLPPCLFKQISDSKLLYSFKEEGGISLFSAMHNPAPISFYENFYECGFGLRLEVTTISGQHMGYALLLISANKNKPILSMSKARFLGYPSAPAFLLKWKARFLGAPNGFPGHVLCSTFHPAFEVVEMKPDNIMVVDQLQDMPYFIDSSQQASGTYSILGSALNHLLKGGKMPGYSRHKFGRRSLADFSRKASPF